MLLTKWLHKIEYAELVPRILVMRISIVHTPPQAKLRWHHNKLGPKCSKPSGGQRFGKDVSKLIEGGDKPNIQFLVQHFFSDKMEVEFDMLRPCMKLGIHG